MWTASRGRGGGEKSNTNTISNTNAATKRITQGIYP